jgi:hypothetical protein
MVERPLLPENSAAAPRRGSVRHGS